VTINGKHFSYDAAYSPDGVGNLGSLISSIYSMYPENTTNKFLSTMNTRRA